MGDNLSQDQDRLLNAIKAELEQMRLDQRGPSRIGTPAPSAANIVKKITQTAHGFAVGDTVVLVSSVWVLTDASSSGNVTRDSVVGVVGKISDVDNFLCVFYGAMCVPSLSTSYAVYFLDTSTPGAVTHTRPVTGVRYSIFSSLGDDLVWVDPSHSASVMDDLDDVAITSVADGNVLIWQASSSTWVNAAPGSISLPSIAGLSVLGRASNTAGVVAAITASTTGDVLHMGASSLVWGKLDTASYNDASVTYAKIQNVAGLSVVGRASNSSGVTAAITAGTDGHVLRLSGTTLGFGLIGTVNMDALIVPGGPTGSSSVVPIITYDAAGRLTTVSTATITPAAIGAVDTATFASHTHSLAGDVGGTTAATVIGNLKVTTATIAANAVTTAKIAAAAVTATELAADAVITVKILDANVTLAKMANLAADEIIGRAHGAGTGVPTALSSTQATAILDVFSASGGGHLKGLVPDPGSSSGSTRFLCEDATWAVPTRFEYFSAYGLNQVMSTSITTVIFGTETDPLLVYDNSTGEYTVGTTGYYLLSYSLSASSSGHITSSTFIIVGYIYIGGSQIDSYNPSQGDRSVAGGSFMYAYIAKTVIVHLTAGDVITIRASANGTGGFTSATCDGNFSATLLPG